MLKVGYDGIAFTGVDWPTYLPEQFDRSRANRLYVDEVDDVAAEQSRLGDGHVVWKQHALAVFRGQRDAIGQVARRGEAVRVLGAYHEQVGLAGFQERLREVSRV